MQMVGRGSPSPPLGNARTSANGRLGEPSLPNNKGELKGGTMGEPDDWLGTYVRSIHSGLRFPFERMNRFGGEWGPRGSGGGKIHSVLQFVAA